VRRALALVAVLIVVASCTKGIEEATDVLSGSPAPSTPPPGGSGPGPTPAPDGRPAVIVTSPAAGDELVSPIEVAGRAFVSEGEVTIAFLDANGTPLASTRTEVSCGAECRGAFSARVAFFVQERGSGSIAVFEVSAEDGSAVNVVSVPVTFVPGS
jgi:hypothetical protein